MPVVTLSLSVSRTELRVITGFQQEKLFFSINIHNNKKKKYTYKRRIKFYLYNENPRKKTMKNNT